MSDDARAVVHRHLVAVVAGDVVAMADDYAEDAVLERGGDRFEGRAAIGDYFRTVPGRLAGGRVDARMHTVDGDRVVVRWRIHGGPQNGIAGVDHYRVVDGAIRAQQVELSGSDF